MISVLFTRQDSIYKSLGEVAKHVQEFIFFAETHPEITFLVTEVGCGIAGFTIEQIAPLFEHAYDMNNVRLPKRFLQLLVKQTQ